MQAEVLEPSQYNLWNDFVDNSPQGDVFCYSWWLNGITNANFRIIVIIEDGRIMAGMPLAYDAQGKINLPPLTRTLGVLYRNDSFKSQQLKVSVERRWLRSLLDGINRDDFVQTCLHHNVSDWLPYQWKGLRQTTRCTYLMIFKGSTITELWKNLDKLRKRTIRKAENGNIKVSFSENIGLVHKYTSMTFRRQGLKFHIPFDDLKNLDESIVKNGKRVIMLAHADDKIHAVLYAAFFNDKSAYYLLSGSDPDLRSLGGHTLVMWEAIKYFHDKVGYFNFGGSDVENIESHIKGFGGTLTPYFHIFNEDNLAGNYGLMYHLNKVSHHTIAFIKLMKNRILQNINPFN